MFLKVLQLTFKKKQRIMYVLCFLMSGVTHAQKISKSDVLYDLEYLVSSIEQTHINPFAYTSKNDFIKNYEQVKQEVKKDSFTRLEAITMLQQVITKVNNAHTTIAFPAQPYIAYAQANGTIFPLELAFESDQALIRKNWSTENQIETGMEVISINGMPIDLILERMYLQVSAEHENFKNAQIESLSFPRLYWQVFGEVDKFEVQIRNLNTLKTYQLNAIKALEDYEMIRSDLLNYERKLKFLSDISAAYLNPGNFGGNKEKYQKFVDSAFTKIHSRKSENLIIDLRNNPGGDDVFSDYLVAYLATKPFKWASKYQLKTSALLKEHVSQTKDTTIAFWKSVFQYEDGTIYPYDFGYVQPQPESKRFKGKVYVLINRQSYSQSTVTAAQIQDYGWATLVGEETTEHPNLYASIFQYKLPKTGITVHVPKGKMIRMSGNLEERGVIPDITIKDHLLDDKDEILEGLIEKLKAK